MTAMTSTQIETFLQAPRHAVVGTNRADGPPQLSPVWYVYQDGHFYISVGEGSAKHRNLARDPRISVCVDGCYPDYRTIIVYGTAQVVEADNPLQEKMRWRIIRQYHESDEEARQYLEAMQEEVSVLIVVTPDKIISQDFN